LASLEDEDPLGDEGVSLFAPFDSLEAPGAEFPAAFAPSAFGSLPDLRA
jgi:hypothetical protein